MYTLDHRPIPTASLTLSPRELELIEISLRDSAAESEECGEGQAVEFTVLLRKFVKAHASLITH
jgi:hypothetical protein